MTTDPITLRASELMREHGFPQSQAYAQAAREFVRTEARTEARTEHMSLRVSTSQLAKAKALGGGHASVGMRLALDAAPMPGE